MKFFLIKRQFFQEHFEHFAIFEAKPCYVFYFDSFGHPSDFIP